MTSLAYLLCRRRINVGWWRIQYQWYCLCQQCNGQWPNVLLLKEISILQCEMKRPIQLTIINEMKKAMVQYTWLLQCRNIVVKWYYSRERLFNLCLFWPVVISSDAILCRQCLCVCGKYYLLPEANVQSIQ